MTKIRLLTLLTTLALLLTGCGDRVEPAQLRTVGEHVGEIRGTHTVGQTFVAWHDGLQSVDVLLATFARENSQPITFHLRADPHSETDLRTVTVPASEIVDNAYHRFSFAPLPDTHHRRYTFVIDSPAAQPGDAITAWVGPPDGYRDGSLYVDGQAQEGQLAFKLGYSNAHILWGLARDLLTAVPAALATAALLVLPGLALLLWLTSAQAWDKTSLLIASTGLSAALFPLLLLLSRPVGLRWNPWTVWLFILVCAAAVAGRLRRLVDRQALSGSAWRARLRQTAPETWLFWAVAALVVGVRWFVARPVSVPMWGDSVQHTVMARLIVEHGGLFDAWEPYSPYTSLTTHFGFHATTAFFHWTTGIGVTRAVVLVGQIFNALAVLALYPLAVRAAGHRWAGVATVLIAGLLMPLPMEYINWGRYPQLAGQMILPVALWLLWKTLDDADAVPLLRLAALSGVAAAGMSLTYYRMPYYYAAFALPLLIVCALTRWRADRRRWFDACKRLLVIGSVAAVLILPWLPNILGGNLATAVSAGVSAETPVRDVLAQYRAWRNLGPYVPRYLLYLALAALAWSVVRRRWTAALAGLWGLGMAALVAARLVRLPGANLLNNFAIHIALYMPASVLAGWLAGELVGWLVRDRRKATWLVGVAVLGVALWGVRARMTVVDPRYALVSRADEAAMDWIVAHTPPDAVFLVNGFLIYNDTSAVGSDAGWWIPYFTRRANTMPPQYALFNEAERTPGYSKAVVQLVADLDAAPPVSPDGLAALCRFGVTHVYVGQGQGQVAAQKLTPYLVPAELVASPDFDLLYHEDRVWIFALREGACP